MDDVTSSEQDTLEPDRKTDDSPSKTSATKCWSNLWEGLVICMVPIAVITILIGTFTAIGGFASANNTVVIIGLSFIVLGFVLLGITLFFVCCNRKAKNNEINKLTTDSEETKTIEDSNKIGLSGKTSTTDINGNDNEAIGVLAYNNIDTNKGETITKDGKEEITHSVLIHNKHRPTSPGEHSIKSIENKPSGNADPRGPRASMYDAKSVISDDHKVDNIADHIDGNRDGHIGKTKSNGGPASAFHHFQIISQIRSQTETNLLYDNTDGGAMDFDKENIYYRDTDTSDIDFNDIKRQGTPAFVSLYGTDPVINLSNKDNMQTPSVKSGASTDEKLWVSVPVKTLSEETKGRQSPTEAVEITDL